MASPILSQRYTKEKLYIVMGFLLSLQWASLLALLAIVASILLFVFTVLIDAFMELCMHISQVWQASTSIERLLILVLAFFFTRSVAPVAIRIYKQRGL